MKPSKASLIFSFLLLTAGCLGGTPTAETEQSTTVQTTTTTQAATPTISNGTARTKAITYHDEQTRSLIDHYDDAGVGRPDAGVVNVSSTGIYVRVQQEYWYTSGDQEADGVNEATYFVNETTLRQVYWY
ncbi:hypothetical protein [Haloferax sp. DFSO60]|uniref:hypothetical protein n=1 Tax=Haloferax sp. DFSO60 TaxID=3388652 RepID=UPI00397E0A9B